MRCKPGQCVATRPKNGRPFEIREFYTPSSTEYSADKFRPDTWVNITGVLPAKMIAMQQYPSELEQFPHPRSLRGLSVMGQFFGSQVGVHHAEAFATALRVI